jgi:hypothetical protein
MYRGNFSSMLIKNTVKIQTWSGNCKAIVPPLKNGEQKKEFVTPGLEQIKLFNTDDAPVWVTSAV